ncbi:cytochrome c oxidase subunit 8B [Clarias gariepinus]|uniref:uncharacterized protein LOC128531471 n=1 Tax=Clarias gariepinus TaxID=13013 RepID=UPI00234D4710|nr:uncharacterized protein LOC128531471 [Clarias gariepinus]
MCGEMWIDPLTNDDLVCDVQEVSRSETVTFRADLRARIINSAWQVNSKVTGLESGSVELNAAAAAAADTLPPPFGSAEGIMQALSLSSGLFRAALRQHLTPRASITSKPAKHVLSTGEQLVAMATMFMTILVPSGWILTNLEEYKKKRL